VTRLDEVTAKLDRTRQFLDEADLGAMVVNTRANFAWLTAGGLSHVVLSSESGVGSLVVTPDGQHLLTDNIEAPRLEDEEVGDLPFEIHYMQWDEADTEEMLSTVASEPWGADATLPFARDVSDSFNRLRWQLMEPEIERYEQLATMASEAVAETGREIERGMTEHEIAGILMGKAFSAGAQPFVALIATDERVLKYRHPIPTDKTLDRHAMLVIGVTKWGLGSFATRMVHFGAPPSELRDRHAACCYVDACLNLETVPGAEVAEIFEKATVAYEETGYPDEWRLHHQGGATGYAGREYKGTLDIEETVLANQPFAWNPSIAGTKSEDTIITIEDGQRFLTEPAGWPTLPVEYEGTTLERPDILVR
jgi:Xaa-Pro aminopeptidase